MTVDGAAVERLREALDGDAVARPHLELAPEPPALDWKRVALRRARAAATRALEPARPYVGRALDLLAERVGTRVGVGMAADVERATVDVELVKGELRSLQSFVALGDVGPAGPGSASPLSRLEALGTNLELLKGDVRALDAALAELGQAIAPAAGLPGVPGRFAELRDRVNALDRRLRTVESAPAAAPAPVTADGEPVPAAPAAAPAADRFDYVGFERRFRGDPDDVLRTLSERYLDLLTTSAPVLDVGCGRGELLAALAERGVPCSGVDLDAGMVAEARAAGLDVAEGDAIAHLRSLPEASLGSIIAVHVAEHLPLPALLELLELAASRLRPGGLLVAETPNPASLVVLGNSYILDPTHVWPLHPSLFTFLCERAGFRDVELRFHSPAEAYHLPRIDVPQGGEWAAPVNDAVDRLNDVLFGPQEYAVLARTPPAT
jgi:SAM-dependent methyltransferase